MATATDELRCKLDELGVEWKEPNNAAAGHTTYWTVGVAHWSAVEFTNGLLCVTSWAEDVTIEQAIATTLRSDDIYTREDVEAAFVSGYSLGLDMFDCTKQDKGWNQNERDLDEEMAELGWVRDTGTCHAVETESMSCSCNDVQLYNGKWVTGLPLTVHIMKCSECGGTYKHVNGSYEFCPRCGRKVVDE